MRAALQGKHPVIVRRKWRRLAGELGSEGLRYLGKGGKEGIGGDKVSVAAIFLAQMEV